MHAPKCTHFPAPLLPPFCQPTSKRRRAGERARRTGRARLATPTNQGCVCAGLPPPTHPVQRTGKAPPGLPFVRQTACRPRVRWTPQRCLSSSNTTDCVRRLCRGSARACQGTARRPTSCVAAQDSRRANLDGLGALGLRGDQRDPKRSGTKQTDKRCRVTRAPTGGRGLGNAGGCAAAAHARQRAFFSRDVSQCDEVADE